MMAPLKILALHGFLNTPKIWDRCVHSWSQKPQPQWTFPNLYRDPEFETKSWETWPRQFKQWSERQGEMFPFVLMGYSMGGRLAIELVRTYPMWFSHLILISTRVGLLDSESPQERLQWQKNWEKRILQDSWGNWTKDWNNQAIFSGDQTHWSMKEHEATPQALAHSLEAWSVLNQPFGWKDLSEIEVPTLWLSGDNDRKMQELMAVTQKNHTQGEFKTIEAAGHRIPLDQPHRLVQHIHDFIKKG